MIRYEDLTFMEPMLDDVKEVMPIEEHYHDHSAISNSDISKFLESPLDYYYYKYKEKKEEFKKYFKFGSDFDLYILNYEKFKDTYILREEMDSPSHSTHSEFCNLVIEGKDGLEAYKASYASASNQSKKKIEEKVAELITRYKDYIDFKKKLKDSPAYTSEQSKQMSSMKMALLDHPGARKLLMDDHQNRHNHVAINVKTSKYSLRGELDSVIIDEENKKIYLTDLKTTANINYFHYEILKRSYHRQLAHYTFLLLAWLKDKGFSIGEYTFYIGIVAVSKEHPYQVRYIPMQTLILADGYFIAQEALEDLAWHKENDKWKYRREAYRHPLGEEYFEEFEPKSRKLKECTAKDTLEILGVNT